MNVIFMTLLNIKDINERNIYTDLMREFVKHGDNVYIVSPSEKRYNEKTHIIKKNNVEILKPQIGNVQKTNIIEKGISTVALEGKIKKAIKKYWNNVKFDLILYSTPPITLTGAVEFVKKRDGAKTYLLLKDIFPQNAVDMGMMSKTGVKSVLYKYFRSKEKKLYALSDRIGCMSQANVDYVTKHNPEVNPESVEICPNSVEPIDMSVDEDTKIAIRQKYEIPVNKRVFVYGGNLGKPQGIDFLIKCLERQKDNEDVFFLIVGDGTEFGKIEAYVNSSKQKNLRLMKRLPKEDYDIMVGACDVGMIFLDHRFTIPNFPSRLLSYMQAKIPVLAVTDINTDIGKVIVDGGFGWWCESNDIDGFDNCLKQVLKNENIKNGANAWTCLINMYTCEQAYSVIKMK